MATNSGIAQTYDSSARVIPHNRALKMASFFKLEHSSKVMPPK